MYPYEELMPARECWTLIFDWDFAHLYNDWYMAISWIASQPHHTVHP